ncbi:MAG: YgiQ family radical SAM protein [Oscillospiraceae bacterium]|jgi:uncharacterized radical SAM protein YgiQ|nr:YgiQ family radical SAM protein [Oscillospiraceae bacterium]
MNERFLPINLNDCAARNWEGVDFAVVTGDAYVDHPSFGAAVISRVLESEGFRVGIIAQPDIKLAGSVSVFGRPKLGFMVTSGNIDSMVAHYTAAKRKRREDAYSPGGKAGLRPDRALRVYSRLIKEAFPGSPVILGGLEASMRRFSHYDYWDDCVFPSELVSCGADLLVYGMGERATVEIARALESGVPAPEITNVRGTVYLADTPPRGIHVALPSHENVCHRRDRFASACKTEYAEQDFVTGKTLVQPYGNRFLVQNPPQKPLERNELDKLAELPFTRGYHPVYQVAGGVPALAEVKFSVIHNRGCFGACRFCSIAFHQGRTVTSRSHQSVLAEAEKFVRDPDFKGYIHDVGGPTANFRERSCEDQKERGMCRGKECLVPLCPRLKVSHTDYSALLRKLRALQGVKKVFIRSGLRFDYLMADKDGAFFRELVAHHTSGQLKVAPEHCAAHVLALMGKPRPEVYKKFAEKFRLLTKEAGKEQYLVPYLMSSHPGSRPEDALELALFLKKERIRPEQVQDFYPTPGTLSTCMYYTGLNPLDGKPVYVARQMWEKDLQRALLQAYKPENRGRITEGLKRAGLGHRIRELFSTR